ncbi:MAG TPA: T9SS type A sorting domain-containing protein, partial [Bacteroidia bacterium]|nr:T9SS type A sorting domain-containing protein [Bacteroidia bacterium]
VSFTQSSDGGATWSKEIQLGDCNGTSFMVLACPMLHVVWPNNGSIYYSRNPTAAPSCPTTPTGIESVNNTAGQILLYPNPVQYSATIVFDGSGTRAIELYDITGRKINSYESVLNQYTFLCNELSPGMYFVKITTGNNTQVVKFIKQ